VIWSASPIRTSGVYPDWVQWYGRTKFAQDNHYYGSSDGYHPGLDLGASSVIPHDGGASGTPVYAGLNGIVLDSKTLDTEGFGQVKISLSDGTTAWYQHLDPSSIKVSNPNPVGPDTIIGYLETTQRHVHLEKRTSIISVENPLPYFEPGLRNILIQNHHGQYDQTTYVAGYPNHPLGQPALTFH
jgi:murein DD-endopeptidase MepM/ murein hydrolase activator NlpD